MECVRNDFEKIKDTEVIPDRAQTNLACIECQSRVYDPIICKKCFHVDYCEDWAAEAAKMKELDQLNCKCGEPWEPKPV